MGDCLGQTTAPCTSLPATPAHHHPPSPGLHLPLCWAWLSCGFLPCQSGGLQPAQLLGTPLCCHQLLWQAGKLQMWHCFPCRRAPTFPQAQGACEVLDNGWEHSIISTWRPREENGGDDQAFQTSRGEPPSSPANASERIREPLFCSFSFLCSELSMTIPYSPI